MERHQSFSAQVLKYSFFQSLWWYFLIPLITLARVQVTRLPVPSGVPKRVVLCKVLVFVELTCVLSAASSSHLLWACTYLMWHRPERGSHVYELGTLSSRFAGVCNLKRHPAHFGVGLRFFQSEAGVLCWQEQNVSVCVIGTSLSDFRKHVARWGKRPVGRGGSVLTGPWLVKSKCISRWRRELLSSSESRTRRMFLKLYITCVLKFAPNFSVILRTVVFPGSSGWVGMIDNGCQVQGWCLFRLYLDAVGHFSPLPQTGAYIMRAIWLKDSPHHLS